MQFISLPNDVYSFAELNRLSLSQCRFKYLYQIWNAGLNLKSRICIRLIQMFCWWHLCLWRLLAYVSSSYLKIRPPVYAVQDKRSSMLDPKLSERHTGSTNGFGNKVKKAAALMERWSVSLKARFLKRKLLQRLICVLCFANEDMKNQCLMMPRSCYSTNPKFCLVGLVCCQCI